MNEPVVITFRDGMRIKRKPPREETPAVEDEPAETAMDQASPLTGSPAAAAIDSPEFPPPPSFPKLRTGNYESLNHEPRATAAAAAAAETDYDCLNAPRKDRQAAAAAAAAAETDYDTLVHPRNEGADLPLEDPPYDMVNRLELQPVEPTYDTTHVAQAGDGPADHRYAMVDLAKKSEIV